MKTVLTSCLLGASCVAMPGSTMKLMPITIGESEEMLVNYEVKDGNVVWGDIMLGREEELLGEGKSKGEESAAIDIAAKRWPKGVVPYYIDPRLEKKYRATEAIKHWNENTKIRLVQRTNERNYLVFTEKTGCYSALGMQGGQQIISVGKGCGTGNTVHEIGHALGLYHTQSRTDRDKFINVNVSNVRRGYESQFYTYKQQGRPGVNIGPYDLGSIMHYSAYSFSGNGQPTITTKSGSTRGFGQRNALSKGDIESIHALYRNELALPAPKPEPVVTPKPEPKPEPVVVKPAPRPTIKQRVCSYLARWRVYYCRSVSR